MNKRSLIILVIILALCTISTNIAYGESELTNSLRENLIPLETVEAGNGFEDLMPLYEIFRDKKIIAMGEATHGTREFCQMKHRMFEFLVEEMGFRVFAIETDFGGAQIVNDYIVKGVGDAQLALEGLLLWPSRTAEVEDMINWMKEYNEANEDKIKFYGFDMQSITISMDYVLDYLGRFDSSRSKEYVGFKDITNPYYRATKEEVEEFRYKTDILYDELIDKKSSYIQKTSEEEYHIIIQHLTTIIQWIDFRQEGSTFNTRDYYMSENVQWILEYENKHYNNDKIMLWAHNMHISNSDFMNKTMGMNLKEIYNEEYYALGFDFYQGSFTAIPFSFYSGMIGKGLAKLNMESTPKGSFSDEMQKTGIPISLLDIKKGVKDDEILKFLSSKIRHNAIGATYMGKTLNENLLTNIIVKDYYDGVIFIKSTTEAKRPSNEKTILADGNRLIRDHYIYRISIILIILLAIFIINFKKDKLEFKRDNKFYILGKHIEGKEDISKAKALILKVNNYFDGISTTRYIMIITIVASIITGAILLTHGIDRAIMLHPTAYRIILAQFVISIFHEIGKIILFYILPLIIVKNMSKYKDIDFGKIVIVSIILGIIKARTFLSLGLLLCSLSLIMNSLYIFVYLYTYSLFYYKGKRPFVVVSTIVMLEYILVTLCSTLLQ